MYELAFSKLSAVMMIGRNSGIILEGYYYLISKNAYFVPLNPCI